jgi:Flp pilus assembly protein TadG
MSRLRRPKGIRSRGIRGQALVEFALVIPIFLLVMLALFDLGRAVFAYNTLTNAAREGVRMAIVNQDVTTIRNWAKSQTAIVELDDPSVTVEFRQVNADGTPGGTFGCPAVGCLAIVSFQATYHPITPIISNILFGSGVTFTAKSVLSVEYHCPNLTFTAAQCPKQP